MRRIATTMLIVFAVSITLIAQYIPWMDPYWVQGAKLDEAEAVVIAIDTSGSILYNPGRLPTEKAKAIDVIKYLFTMNPYDPVIEVVTFNSTIQSVISPTYLGDLDLGWAVSTINAINATDNLTWLNGAIEYACNLTQPASPWGTLVLLTDGLPTTPYENGSKDISTAVSATYNAAQYFRDNCSILAVIGIALEEDAKEFLREIASPGAFINILPTGVCPCPTGLCVPEDYSTIEDAIDAAESGDCINVGPGTYREELWIDKDIILCGAGADVTTIEGNITIASGSPDIEGFRITGSSFNGITVNHYTKPTIRHNIIENNPGNGIDVWSKAEAEISYNIIRHNDYCGVKVDEGATVTGTDNEIYDNGQDLCPSEEDFPPGFKE